MITNSVLFSSVLKTEYRDELEALMFFNSQQGIVRADIVESIEKHGIPKIVVDGEFLRINVGEFSDVQTLFAFEDIGRDVHLIAIVIYVRINTENVIVLHIAVKEEYAIRGGRAEEMLLMRLIIKLKEIASRIRGVKSITLMYDKGAITRISV